MHITVSGDSEQRAFIFRKLSGAQAKQLRQSRHYHCEAEPDRNLIRHLEAYMCHKRSWTNTYDLLGIDKIEEWTYCRRSNGDQPCRRVHVHDHGDINMAPNRPRSVGYDVPLVPRIIERRPENEVREVFPSRDRSTVKEADRWLQVWRIV